LEDGIKEKQKRKKKGPNPTYQLWNLSTQLLA
jgi:hypothetical protein